MYEDLPKIIKCTKCGCHYVHNKSTYLFPRLGVNGLARQGEFSRCPNCHNFRAYHHGVITFGIAGFELKWLYLAESVSIGLLLFVMFRGEINEASIVVLTFWFCVSSFFLYGNYFRGVYTFRKYTYRQMLAILIELNINPKNNKTLEKYLLIKKEKEEKKHPR
ncbi:MAG: hypothetical protein WC974_01115 [Thermoplasmata archaeon]